MAHAAVTATPVASSDLIGDGTIPATWDKASTATKSSMRRRFTNEQRLKILRSYLELPRGKRKDYVREIGVEASLLSRWHWQFFGKAISSREPGDSLDPKLIQSPRKKRGQGPGPNVRSVSRASYDELKMELAVCKGLLTLANRRGFLEHFLAVQPDEMPELEDDDGDTSK
jgi:transposase-like protein